MILQEQIDNLKRTLEHEESARKIAEELLEQRSAELRRISEELEQSNKQIKELSCSSKSTPKTADDFDLIRLKEDQEKHQILLKNSPVGMFLANPMGNGLAFSNDAISKMLGFTNEELKTENVAARVHQDDLPRLKKEQIAMHNGEKDGFSIKLRMLTKEGKSIWIKLTISAVRDTSGKVISETGISEDITHEKKLSALLKEQQEKLETLINHSPIGIVLSKNKGRGAILANAATCKILGYTEKELKSTTVSTVVHADDMPGLQKESNAMHNGEKDEFSLKLRLLTKENKIVSTKFSVVAIRDASGEIKYEAITFEDITKENELNDRVKLSEMLLANLIADAPVGILMVNEFGKVTLANKKLCDIFHLEAAPEELVGYEGSTLAEQCKLSARDPKRFIEKVKQLHKRKSMILKEEIEFADGRVFERHCMPLSYQNKDRGLLVSYTNITAASEFEQKLQEQKEKYATVIANMNLGWTETDPDGYITWANKSFCKLSGYTLEELIGQQGQELLLANDSRNNTRYYNDQEQKVYKSHSIQIKTKNRTIKHLLVSGMRKQDVNGDTDGSIGITFDITEQKELEKQKEKLLKELESQNEQLNDYAHVVSHDLKSPLRSISALVAWTKEDFSKGIKESALENLALIEEKVEKMDALIENILKYSSLDQGHFINTDIDLNLLVHETLQMILVPEHIKVRILKKLPVLNADATKMQQLFQNLLSNAVHHIDKPEGKVEIDFFDDTSHYRFAIKDNGVGIKKDNHDKIFKIFRTFDDNENSTGIGLSIVKKIVEIYEGEIWVDSELGKGATFFFTLKKQL